jgi:hypothetical protein
MKDRTREPRLVIEEETRKTGDENTMSSALAACSHKDQVADAAAAAMPYIERSGYTRC